MKIHFIAIGGSAMHSLAIALKKNGDEVSGSDDEIFEPSKSRLVRYDLLPDSIGWDPDKILPDLDAVVLGMHARANNPELIKARALGLPIYSYPEYIYEHSRKKKRIVIGGSHGKTTCTAMLMHVLKGLNQEFDYLVGASIEGFSDSVRLSDSAPIIIIEGDEYLSSPIDPRPKFILYRAQIALITGIAWDHVNVFPTFEIYKNQFRDFIGSITKDGCLIYCESDPVVKDVVENFDYHLFSSDFKKIAYSLPSYTINKGLTSLIESSGEETPLAVFGAHNLLNLQAVCLICAELGISRDDYLKGISSFKGASRRLQLMGENQSSKIFIDFAHAPSKIKATLIALKEQFPERKLLAIMELHTFSSLDTKFLNEYADSMASADTALVYFNPHTLEHKKLPPLEPKMVKDAFRREDLIVMNQSDDLRGFLAQKHLSGENLVMMSSGNFDGLDLKGLFSKMIS